MTKPLNADNLIKLPNNENHNCFACSPANMQGLRMQFYTDKKRVYSWTSVPPHLCGWGTIAHGGIVTAIADEMMGWTVLSLLKRFLLTKSITIDFLKPVPINIPIYVEGKLLKKASDKEAIIESRVFNNENHDLCARATGTCAIFPIDAITKMGYADEAMIDLYNSVVKAVECELETFPKPRQM